MRILHTADWHLGKNLEGHSRLKEQIQFVDFFVAKCEELKPDLILLAGDVYDNANPPAMAEKLFYDTLKKLSRNGECLTLVIAGNHDNPERLIASWPLAMEHGIIMVGTPKTIVETGNYGNHQVVAAGEGYVEIQIREEKAVLLTLPYPTEKRLNEVIYQDNEEEEDRIRTYGEKIAEMFENLEKNFREDTINITVSHLFAFGAEPSGSERSSSLGGSFLVGTNALTQKAQYTALGHIHKPQVLPSTQGKMIYSGSPIHYNKSEPKGNKRFYIIDLEVQKEATIDHVEIPIFKPIEIWKAQSIEEALDLCEEKQGEDSWVYLEVATDRYIREDEIKQMKSLKSDILEIRPLLESIEKERNYEKINEMSFMEQFAEFYKTQRDLEPSAELMGILENILGQEEDNEANETHN